MTEILQPKTLLIDTGHLVNMVQVQRGRPLPRGVRPSWATAYGDLLNLLRCGALIPLFYEPLSYEWIQDNSLERALQIAAVLDQAICVKMVFVDTLLFLIEAMNAAKVVEPSLDYMPFDVIRPLGCNDDVLNWFTRVWPERSQHPSSVPVVISDWRANPTAAEMVRGYQSKILSDRDLWREALDGSRFALQQTKNTQRQYAQKGLPPESFKRYWLRTALRLDEVLRRTSGCADVDEIIRRIDLDACPAICLKVDAYWQYARAVINPTENDIADLTLLAPIPYADFSLIEKRMAEFVRQARKPSLLDGMFHDPTALTQLPQFAETK